MSNKFIVFEGLDGSGKTTLSRMYYDWLLKQGIDAVLITNGYPMIDSALRELKSDRTHYDIRAHFLLALSNSIMTYKTEIEPNINNGKVVILDRYYFTTLAYNIALGLNENWAKNVALIIPKPDQVIFCNASMNKLLERKIQKFEDIELGFSTDPNRRASFINYQSSVRYQYNKLIKEDPSLFTLIDTNQSLEKSFEEIKQFDNNRRKIL